MAACVRAIAFATTPAPTNRASSGLELLSGPGPLAHAHVIDADDLRPVEIATEIVSRSGWLK